MPNLLTTRAKKMLCGAGSAVLLIVRTACLLASMLLPTAEPIVAASNAIRTEKSIESETHAAQPFPSLCDFEDVWDKPLYSRPSDRVLADAEEELVEIASVDFKLLATIVEPNRAWAMFASPTGEMEIKGKGQAFSLMDTQYEVVDIEPRRVVVRHDGKLVALSLDAEE